MNRFCYVNYLSWVGEGHNKMMPIACRIERARRLIRWDRLPVCAMVLMPISAQAVFSEVVRPAFLITAGRAGKIEIGASLKEMRRVVPPGRIRSREFVSENILFLEWTLYPTSAKNGQPLLVIQMKGKPNWRVHTVEVYDRRYATDQGIGPGASLGMVKRVYPMAVVVWSDESTYGVALKDSNVVIRLDVHEPVPDVDGFPPAKDLTAVPDSTKVKTIVVY